ncbi:MAG: YaiI/YqxD family protein [Alphaproteobacteria bacterium]
MTEIYVDSDGCPVKEEALRVAVRHGLVVHFVSDRWQRGLDHPLARKVVVTQGADAADDWIAARIGHADIAVTTDIPLARRCLDRGAQVIGPSGRPFTEASIGMAMAMRDLKAQLREAGTMTGGPPAFSRQDRSRFLSALEVAVQASKRVPPAPP